MDIWHLQVFQKVVELRGFSAAAKALNLTQPTVSSHIKELEAYYGCRLVDRLGRQTLPTGAGELIYTYAEKLIHLFGESKTALAAFSGDISGLLTLGGSTIPGTYLLPRFIGQFIQDFPRVRVAVTVNDTEQIIEKLLNDDIEAAVVGAPVDSGRIHQQKWFTDDMRLIVPAGHPWADKQQVSLDQLAGEPFIVREQGSGTLQSIQNSLSRIGASIDDLRIVAEMGSTPAVIQGIKHRVGISILSTVAVADELAFGALAALTVEGVNLTRYFYLTSYKDRTPSPLCRAFMRFIENAAIKEPL